MQTLTPEAVNVRCHALATPLQCALSDEQSVAALRRSGIPAEKLAAMVKLHCLRLNELLNLRNPLNTTTIDTIADSVVTEYNSLNFADIRLVFKRGAEGYYSRDGEVLAVNLSIVMSWFRRYFDERCHESYNEHLREHEAMKAGWARMERSSKTTTLKEFIRRGKQ